MFINENHTKIVTSILLPNTSELERSMFVNVYSILACLIKLLSLSKVKTIEEITLAAENVAQTAHCSAPLIVFIHNECFDQFTGANILLYTYHNTKICNTSLSVKKKKHQHETV